MGASKYIPDQSAIRQRAEIIYRTLIQQPARGLGLMSGLVGKALFYYYYGRALDAPEAYASGWAALEEAFERINRGEAPYSHCNGIAGVGWGLEHLAAQGFIDPDVNEVLDDLDDSLAERMLTEMRAGNFDFLHGSAGLVMYFLQRRRSRPRKVERYLKAWMTELENAAETGPENTLKWRTLVDARTGGMGYQINLSHGNMSLVAILSKIYAAGIDRARAADLADRAGRYVLLQRIDDRDPVHVFPTLALESMGAQTELGCRLGWCFGDLGIGLAFRQSGRRLGKQDWVELADYTLLKTTRRQSEADTQVVDACLCHGAAGVGHVYHRVWRDTGLPAYREASDYWLARTLEMAQFPDGLAGYKTYFPDHLGGWSATDDVIEGITGVGFVLLNYLSDQDPSWDEAFLIS